ncbi:MAG: hypothetical protein WDN26_17205 [Chitinophagaceae bacterium]
MRKIFFITILAVLFAATSQAQFKKLMDKVKNKTEQRVDKRTDEAIDKKLDEIEGKDKPSTTKQESEPAPTDQPKKSEEPTLKSFSKYDFVAGEAIIYYDNYEGEAVAELPTNWNTNGTGEIVTLDKYTGQWLRVHAPFVYLTSNQKEFSENYTVEFDMILQLKNNGWMYPEIKFGLISTKDEPTTDNKFLSDYKKYASLISTLYPENLNHRKCGLTPI